VNKLKVSVSDLKLLSKEYSPTNDLYFIDIVPNYVDIVL